MEGTENTETDNVYDRDLAYYKRDSPFQRHDSSRSPVQIVLPDKKMLLGYSTRDDHSTNADVRSPPLKPMIMVLPTLDSALRIKMAICLLIMLLPLDFTIASCLYFLDSDQGPVDILIYITSSLILVLGGVAIRNRSARLLTLFTIVVYVDCMVSLVRLYTVIHFLRFLVQLCICKATSHLRANMLPIWFSPVRQPRNN